MLLRCRMVMAWAAWALLLMAAIACGPVAPEDALTPAALQQPAPLSDSGSAETPTPTHTPAPTPKPTETPTPLPTLPPKPTETPTALPPKPTPLPTLPPKPTETPLPTPYPTPDLRTPAPTLAPDTPHPEGLAGCREYNFFGSPITEGDYLGWCNEEFSKLVISACSGLATSEAEHNCGREELADVSDYFIREGPIQCDAVADSSYQQECFSESYQNWEKFFSGLEGMWPKVRLVVARDAAVITAQRDVMTCLEASGYESIDSDLLFPWQVFEDPTVYEEREAGYTEAEKAMRLELWEPADQCARQHGFYEAQDAAWLAELNRLSKEEPEAAKPLLDAGLLEILQAPGAAAFLKPD